MRRSGWIVLVTLVLSPAARADEPVYETVVRTRAADEMRLEDDPATFAVVLRIRDPAPGSDLSVLLERVPGLRVIETGTGGRQSLTIRGADSHQTVVLLDGIRITAAGASGVDLSLIEPGLLEQVEVRRGGGSARFGSNALGGVLLLSTPSMRTRPRTKLALGYGAFNSLALRASRSAPVTSSLRYLVSGSYRQSDGDFAYVDSNGQARLRTNNDSRLGDVLVKLDYLLSERWQVGLMDSLSVAYRGAPGMSELPSETARQQDLHNLTSLRLTRSELWVEGGSLELTGYHRFTRFGFDQPYEPPIPEAHSHNSTFIAGSTVRLALPFPGLGRLDGGAEIRGQLFRDADTNDPTRAELDLWASSQTRLLGRYLVLVPAVRLTSATGFRATVVPRGGLVLRPLDGLELAGNIGRSFRLPSFQEMYIRLDGFGGNADLRPEDALDGDVGLRWRISALSLEGVYFRRWIKNIILFAPESPTLVRANNYEGASAQGVELSADLRPGLGFRLQGAYTYTRTRFGDPPMSLPGHPRHRLVSRLGWQVPWIGRGFQLELWSAAILESARVLSRFNATEEEGRLLLATGGALSWRWITLRAEGQNLLDKRDALDTVGFPLPPARFFVSLAAAL